jgi:hypothetical protein
MILTDREIAWTVNALTEVAKHYGKTEQCRDRIAHLLVPILKGEGFPRSIVAAYAMPPVPIAWRVRGYSHRTGEPRPWRYVDGPDKPAVNNPEECEFEPLYAAGVDSCANTPYDEGTFTLVTPNCNCPGENKPDKNLHAPNCPYRNAGVQALLPCGRCGTKPGPDDHCFCPKCGAVLVTQEDCDRARNDGAKRLPGEAHD